jgi:protein-tyrosine phosphatase
MPDFSEIVPGLFIGDIYSVTGNYTTLEQDVLDILKIDVVISVLSEEEYEDHLLTHEEFDSKIWWYRLVVDDDLNEKISEHFSRVHAIISEALKMNKVVMIHCKAGMSRSPTLVIAYLMIENGWDYEEAFAYVKKNRPIISPNSGFIKQLKML